MRTTAILSTIVLSASVLAGCGSDGGNSAADYCDDLKDAKSDIAALESDAFDIKAFEKAIDTVHELADGAPSEVEAEWKAMDEALTALTDGLEDAGLSMEDLGAILSSQIPEGMTAEEVQQVMPELQKTFTSLSTDEVQKANEKIEKHAKSECDIDLSSDS
jgi:outer membrane murein-binding lipoprotein Lpp